MDCDSERETFGKTKSINTTATHKANNRAKSWKNSIAPYCTVLHLRQEHGDHTFS